MTDIDTIKGDLSRAQTLLGQGRKGIAEALKILRGHLASMPNAGARGRINQKIWECEIALGRATGYFSQSGQDAWLNANVFKNKENGIFVEIGGYNGVTGSNCLFFEMMRGWTGILVEPSPGLHAKAERARRCPCLRVALASTEGEAEFLDVESGMTQMGGLVESYDPKLRAAVEATPSHKGKLIKVPTRPLASILDEHKLTEIDFVSLDVEGGEMDVLSTFPFEKYDITAWTVENNTGRSEINELMTARGYRLAEALGVDHVYLKA
jgi:FkbM family methyltransferase